MSDQSRPVATPAARVGALDAVCVICTRPVPDMAYACPACAGRLDRDLVAAPDLAAELVTTFARQAHTQQAAARAGAAGLLPFDWGSADVRWVLANTLITWARHVAEERGQRIPDLPAGWIGPACHRPACLHPSCVAIRTKGTPRALAVAVHWLRVNREWLRHRREVDQVADEVAYAIRVTRIAVDTTSDRWYAGACDCGAQLYALPDAQEITCARCGLTWPVGARRRWLLGEARDVLATAAEISRALTALGQPVTAAMIRGYGHRGTIPTHGRLVIHPEALYRVGDVLDVLERRAAAGRGEAA